MFVVIEGIDACGKATQSRLLTERLAGHVGGVGTKLYSFHRYGTAVGQLILWHLKKRWSVMCDESPVEVTDGVKAALNSRQQIVLYNARTLKPIQNLDFIDAAVFQALGVMDKYLAAPLILRDLQAGQNVVCDRYWPSAVMYGGDDGLSEDDTIAMYSSLPKPDLYVFLDVPVEETWARRPERRDRYEADREKIERIAKRYRAWWATMQADQANGGRWITVDGRGPVEEVYARILAVIPSTPIRVISSAGESQHEPGSNGPG